MGVITDLGNLRENRWVGNREVNLVFRIKVDCRGYIEFAQGLFYAGQYNLEYSTLVLKFDLRLCRVDVHIYDGRVHREIKEIRGDHVPANQAGIGFRDCFMEKVMFHEPVVHEKILFPVSFPGVLGDAYETIDGNDSRFAINRE